MVYKCTKHTLTLQKEHRTFSSNDGWVNFDEPHQKNIMQNCIVLRKRNVRKSFHFLSMLSKMSYICTNVLKSKASRWFGPREPSFVIWVSSCGPKQRLPCNCRINKLSLKPWDAFKIFGPSRSFNKLLLLTLILVFLAEMLIFGIWNF